MTGRDRPEPRGFDPQRRRFLKTAATGGAVAAIAPAVLAGCGSDDGGDQQVAAPAPVRIPFHGVHQPGVLNLAPSAGIVAALDSHAENRDELRDAFRELSAEAQRIMDGVAPEPRDRAYPPTDSGLFGDEIPPAEISVVVGLGSSLFTDERYGLAANAPRELEKMPFFANDRLDPARSHGDVSITVGATNPEAAMYAFRQLMRRTRSAFTLRWMQEGSNAIGPVREPGKAGARNLLGFKDGTANPDPTDDAVMDDIVWVGSKHREPAWAVGGTYQAIRIIRMFVEFWDRTRLSEQETIIGRHKVTGAPLGGRREEDPIDYRDDPEGERIGLDAHIRLANPRVPATEKNRILRRGFNYSRGFDAAGQLDQGLVFTSFQASLQDGFVTVQKRLDGEPLEEYIRPVGGGFFFVPPGVTTRGGYLAEHLLR
jgi:deferrochelatase/peroxidase EfeB